MKYIVDIDGTICNSTFGEYQKAVPFVDRIQKINQLYDSGNEVHYWTARGSNTGLDWTELTENQLKIWGAKYTSVSVGKPSYDIWIDDKAFNSEIFFSDENISNRT